MLSIGTLQYRGIGEKVGLAAWHRELFCGCSSTKSQSNNISLSSRSLKSQLTYFHFGIRIIE